MKLDAVVRSDHRPLRSTLHWKPGLKMFRDLYVKGASTPELESKVRSSRAKSFLLQPWRLARHGFSFAGSRDSGVEHVPVRVPETRHPPSLYYPVELRDQRLQNW